MRENKLFFYSAEISSQSLCSRGSRGAMNLNWIRAFSIVARHANLTKASHVLHVSQSSISHQLGLLQKDYGVRLYRKTGHGIELTADSDPQYRRVENRCPDYSRIKPIGRRALQNRQGSARG